MSDFPKYLKKQKYIIYVYIYIYVYDLWPNNDESPPKNKNASIEYFNS